MAARKRPTKSRDEIRRNMSAIKSRDTRAEILLRSALHRRGWRFRKNVATLPGRPDIVSTSRRTVIFVDGDFWHAREYRLGGEKWLQQAIHERSRPYWRSKFRRRIARDEMVTAELRSLNWIVHRVWESAILANCEEIADYIARAAVSRDRRAR